MKCCYICKYCTSCNDVTSSTTSIAENLIPADISLEGICENCN